MPRRANLTSFGCRATSVPFARASSWHIRLISRCVKVLVCIVSAGTFAEDPLDRQLQRRDPAAWGAEARRSGKPDRGAVLFYSARLACAKCHLDSDQKSTHDSLGPDLAQWKRKVDDAYLVQSILQPSAIIAPEYRLVRFALDSGAVHVGIPLRMEHERQWVRTGAGAEDLISFPVHTIDEQSVTTVSLMPEGQMQALRDETEFLDLVAYIIAIRDGGPQRARELRPNMDQLALELPEYESRVDHAGMIGAWDSHSLERGRIIYSRMCLSCHGTVSREGSLPTALRFATGPFKRGHDPYSMYQTLTRGSGLMLPQTWMVPRQKYDVIHYIHHTFLSRRQKDPPLPIAAEYLQSLPVGDTLGPEPRTYEPWRDMDYGPLMMTTVEIGGDGRNIAQKGIALRLDGGPGGISSAGHWILYEHDTLRCAGAWSGDRFIDWQGIQFDGQHNIHPHAVGQVIFENSIGPGWADPATGSFADSQRVIGRDGRRYGPLPASWGKFLGLERQGMATVLRYRIGDAVIREQPSLLTVTHGDGLPIHGVVRHIRIEPHEHDLLLAAATVPAGAQVVIQGTAAMVSDPPNKQALVATATGDGVAPVWVSSGSQLVLSVCAAQKQTAVRLVIARVPWADTSDAGRELALWKEPLETNSPHDGDAPSEQGQSTGAGPLWPDEIESTPYSWFESRDWGVDVLVMPQPNRWRARTRVTGIDFYPGADSMAVATWDGDIWRVTGLHTLDSQPRLHWRRIAAGLFQPLGIRVLDDGLMVTCRDQLVRLKDRNGDGEMDLYECFNSDHQVTEHFHEFAMGLQQDGDGNWYYAKSARHALPALVPQHGTLLRVTSDGSRTDIVATGFRAANGVCLNRDGTFIVSDQEGHWNPKNRINWVRSGGFYGNMFGYHDVTDSSDGAMSQPLCWITNAFDRSPAELLWTPPETWGPLAGQLINLSYGYGRLYVVPHQFVGQQPQGGMCPLPIPDLPTGIIRGRFSPHDGQLYVGGMFAWASSRQEEEGGIYRIRLKVDNPCLPIAFRARRGVLELTFSCDLDPQLAADVQRYALSAWDLVRSERYGSDHHHERAWRIERAELQPDGRTIQFQVPELCPTWGFALKADVPRETGGSAAIEFHGTIHGVE